MNTNSINSDRTKDHEMTLKSRSELSVSGVEDVMSFDEAMVELSTLCGVMSIEGEGMHISFLDIENGRLTLTGRVSGMYYIDKKPKRGGLFGNREK